MIARAGRIGRVCLVAFAALALPGLSAPSAGQDGGDVSGIHRFRLSNGLQLVVAVRRDLRLAAVNTTVNIGAIDDPPGQWGIAHLLEHVSLQGSRTIGSLDPRAEAAALDDLDHAHAALDRERRKAAPNPGALVGLERWVDEAQQAATRQAEAGEVLGGRLEARGAIGLNAATTTDSTHFFTWLPPEHAGVWFRLEADRLRNPIFRRFYSERSVVLKEVTAMTGGRTTLSERFLQDVFPGAAAAHPLAGDLGQIAAIDRPAAIAYFKRFYRPENIVIAIVGNVDPAEISKQCERYFGGWHPDGAHEPGRSRVNQPIMQTGVRVRSFALPQSSALYFAFPRPSADSAQHAALEALAATINSAEVSPLYRRLARERPLVTTVRAVPNYPSQKQPPIFLLQVYGRPGVPSTVLQHEVAAALRGLADADRADLAAGIAAAEMHLASQLDDAPTLASLLAFHQAVHNDWRVPFRHLEMLRHLEPEDVRRVARMMFASIEAELAAPIGR